MRELKLGDVVIVDSEGKPVTGAAPRRAAAASRRARTSRLRQPRRKPVGYLRDGVV